MVYSRGGSKTMMKTHPEKVLELNAHLGICQHDLTVNLDAALAWHHVERVL